MRFVEFPSDLTGRTECSTLPLPFFLIFLPTAMRRVRMARSGSAGGFRRFSQLDRQQNGDFATKPPLSFLGLFFRRFQHASIKVSVSNLQMESGFRMQVFAGSADRFDYAEKQTHYSLKHLCIHTQTPEKRNVSQNETFVHGLHFSLRITHILHEKHDVILPHGNHT